MILTSEIYDCGSSMVDAVAKARRLLAEVGEDIPIDPLQSASALQVVDAIVDLMAREARRTEVCACGGRREPTQVRCIDCCILRRIDGVRDEQ